MTTFIKLFAQIPLRLSLGIFLIFILLHITDGVYAMQPPPPPLNLEQLSVLISKADVIIVGKINEAKETEKTVEAVLSIEKLLKGKVAGNILAITEACEPVTTRLPDVGSKSDGEPKKMIVRSRAGPSYYHGKYKQGTRVIILLENIIGTDKYRPLGSGTYDKHLCEFLIEDYGIKTLYFQFADDLIKYAGSENQFIDIIKKFIKSGSNIGGSDG